MCPVPLSRSAEADAEAKAEMLAEVARVLEESCGAVAADEVWERRHGGLLLIATFASRGACRACYPLNRRPTNSRVGGRVVVPSLPIGACERSCPACTLSNVSDTAPFHASNASLDFESTLFGTHTALGFTLTHPLSHIGVARGAAGLLGAEAIGAGAGKATAALTHPEPRVREQAGNTLAALAAAALGVGAPSVYRTHCREAILAGIRDNLERAEDAVEAELEEKLKKRLQPKKPLGVDEILHQSAGWKSLESSCKALLEIAKAVGTEFAPDVTPELLDLITRTLSHTNRFVRETGFQICAELSTLVHECPLDTADVDRAAFDATMSGLVATGLADNWSQVGLLGWPTFLLFSLSCRPFAASLLL